MTNLIPGSFYELSPSAGPIRWLTNVPAVLPLADANTCIKKGDPFICLETPTLFDGDQEQENSIYNIWETKILTKDGLVGYLTFYPSDIIPCQKTS